MRPILFRWRSITVWSYPAMLYVGLVAGVFVGNLAARETGTDALRVFIATLVLIPPAIAGARLLYVAAHWSEYRDDTRRPSGESLNVK
ncbi:MAG: prolipoprotein diacylglyceryl transferase family protein [Gemmatimonadales bacterium]